MSTVANKKFKKVIAHYLRTGDVTVEFNTTNLITTLNGEDFTADESKQLVDDFRHNEAFRKIMEIVNSKSAAQQARDHVNSMRGLQALLDGLGEDDEDFEEDLEDDVEDLDTMTDKDFDTATVDIPGIGKVTVTSLSAVEAEERIAELQNDPEWEEVDTNELGIYSFLLEAMSGLEDKNSDQFAEFMKAKQEMDNMPPHVVKMVKDFSLKMFGQMVIEEAKNVGYDASDINELANILYEVIKLVDETTGVSIPTPSDFVKQLNVVLGIK